jgi:hypothetical protein
MCILEVAIQTLWIVTDCSKFLTCTSQPPQANIFIIPWNRPSPVRLQPTVYAPFMTIFPYWWMSSSGMCHRVDLVWTDVSEESVASIFREEKSASEEPAWVGGRRCHSPDDGILHSHRCENLKSHIFPYFLTSYGASQYGNCFKLQVLWKLSILVLMS